MPTNVEIQEGIDKAKQTFAEIQAKIPTINSSVLTPTPQISYTTPNYVPPPIVTGLDSNVTPPLSLTAPEQEATDLTTRIQRLNDSLTGQSAFRTEQENQQGIPGLLKTQNDLAAQLKAIQNEAQSIPLQLQQEATGRGITAGGLAPIQTARLRTNAIQALSVSSLLEASRGNLTLAQNLVDRAVAAKYDPIKEEIDAATKNLDLILKSPEYSLAEKNRAQAQKDIQDQKARALAKQKEDTATIMSWAAAALANGATPLQAQKITQVAQSDNPDLMTAFALYAPFARDPQAVEAAILDLQAKRDAHDTALLNQKLIKANTAKTYADIENTRADTAKKTTEVASASQPSELKRNALTTAQQLLERFSKGIGTSAVGGNLLNRFQGFGDFLGKGTARADFLVDFNNLKSLLSLDNVKYLKGQGQVSDAERRLLEQASTKLDRSQSDEQFKRSLQDIVTALGGTADTSDTQVVNGVVYKKGADGLYYPQ